MFLTCANINKMKVNENFKRNEENFMMFKKDVEGQYKSTSISFYSCCSKEQIP